MTEKMPKGSDLKGESRAVPPAQPSPAKPGAGPALDLDELDRLEKAATQGPWESRVDASDPRGARADWFVTSLERVILRESRPWFWNDPPRRDEADLNLIAALRNAAPQLLAIAAAAKEVAASGWGTAAKMPESYHFERIAKMEALRAALDSRAGAAPASGDGSIGGVERKDTAADAAPRSL
jgi:hypothetical protein